jgi:putative ABC transport system permease protein
MNDLRFAFRQLAKSPGFTAVAVLTLALGIGACTTIFSVVNRVLLQPLSYPHPEQLVRIRESDPPDYPQFSVAPGNLADWRKQSATFSQLAAIRYDAMNLTGTGQPERIYGTRVTANYLSTLGARPMMGRDFLLEEDTPGRGDVAILGEGMWSARFGKSPAIIGRVIHLDGEPVTVVGVMPWEFHGPDIMVPLALSASELSQHGGHYLDVVGRLKPGTSVAEGKAELAATAKRLEKEFPESNKGWTVVVFPMLEDMVGYIRPQLYTLLGAVGLLLLIGCANVANLILVRSSLRSREIAVRAALGASRMRMVRQIVVENLLLTALGWACGALAAFWGLHLLLAVAPYVPRNEGIRVDGWALGFSFLLAALTGVGFGLVPVLQATRIDLNSVLKDAGRGMSEGKSRHRLRDAIVVAEMTIAIVLLAGAGLLMRSFVRIIKVDPGFNANSAVVASLTLPAKKYSEPKKQAQFTQQALEKLEQIPDVRAVGAVQALPFQGDYYLDFTVEGRPVAPGDQPGSLYYGVSPGYFKAMGIPLLKGRAFTEADAANGHLVTIVSKAMAERFFPHEDPIGKLINFQNPKGTWSEIVGVVGDVRQYSLLSAVQAEAYEPLSQHPFPFLTFVVRTDASPEGLAGAMRSAILSVDSDQPLDNAVPLTHLVKGSVANQRFALNMLVVFSAVALLLATLGIYSVTAFSVAQRTSEIGVRMALGAQQKDVLRMIALQGARLIGIGVILGLAGAIAISRLIASMLYATEVTDPIALGAAPVILSAAAFSACLVSARRAARIDPIVALRAE